MERSWAWGSRGDPSPSRKEGTGTDGANERGDFLNYGIMSVIPAFQGLGSAGRG